MSSKDKIISLPHPSLRKRSAPVKEIDASITELIEDMKSATLDWEASRKHEVGVALAAVQINSLKRVIIVRADNNDPDNQEFDVYINPEITRFEGEPIEELEGCLSVSDLYGYVPRYPKIKIKAQNIHGKTIKQYVRGYQARVFQHEIDHTNGLTFVDRLGGDAEYYLISEHGKIAPLEPSKTSQLMKEYQVDGSPR